jgi:hypothetical protein
MAVMNEYNDNDFREPILETKNGFCYIQNGTYNPVPNNDTWNHVEPLLNILSADGDFFRLLDLGSSEDGKILLEELQAFSYQISKMALQIKKLGGLATILDAQYFQNKIDKISNELENVPYKQARVLEKEKAADFTVEARACIRKCVAENYKETKKLNSNGASIEIPADKEELMKKITQKVEYDEKKGTVGKNK